MRLTGGRGCAIRCVQRGTTPLHLAAETGHTATVEALLAAKAKFTQNEVRTPFSTLSPPSAPPSASDADVHGHGAGPAGSWRSLRQVLTGVDDV